MKLQVDNYTDGHDMSIDISHAMSTSMLSHAMLCQPGNIPLIDISHAMSTSMLCPPGNIPLPIDLELRSRKQQVRESRSNNRVGECSSSATHVAIRVWS